MTVEGYQYHHEGADASSPTSDSAACDARIYTLADRAINVLLAVAILILTAPFILLACLAVKLTSRGPVIYTQVRLGRHGRSFKIFKIRTMHHNCEGATGPRWSTPGDPRITVVGRGLRVSHLDELPQLWNVLRGEMALVGPRPERPEIAEQLARVVPRYSERPRAIPGLTGLAQIQLPPDAAIDCVRRKLTCDLYYMRRRTRWLDVRILVATATGVVGIPFSWPKRLLGIPSLEQMERSEPTVEARVGASGSDDVVVRRGVGDALPASVGVATPHSQLA